MPRCGHSGVSPAALHVFVSNPRLLFDLQCFLQRMGCATTHVRSHELEVEVPDAPSQEQAGREVELYLALWEGRKQFADVEAYISSSDDGRSQSKPFQGG